MKTLSACGRICSDCTTYMNGCLGCYHTRKEKIMEPEIDMCPIYECVMSKYENRLCSECPDLPCAHFSICIDPKLSEQENKQDIINRVSLLKTLR